MFLPPTSSVDFITHSTKGTRSCNPLESLRKPLFFGVRKSTPPDLAQLDLAIQPNREGADSRDSNDYLETIFMMRMAPYCSRERNTPPKYTFRSSFSSNPIHPRSIIAPPSSNELTPNLVFPSLPSILSFIHPNAHAHSPPPPNLILLITSPWSAN